MKFLVLSSASHAMHPGESPQLAWHDDGDTVPGVTVRGSGSVALIDAESCATMRQWLITRPLLAAFDWELKTPDLVSGIGHSRPGERRRFVLAD